MISVRILVIAVGIGVCWLPSFVFAVCGLEQTALELRRELLRAGFAREQTAGLGVLLERSFDRGSVCAVCHIGKFGGPRNDFGSLANVLLTARDRNDSVRQREVARRLLELQLGGNSGREIVPEPMGDALGSIERLWFDLPQTESEAVAVVKRAERESRFGILQFRSGGVLKSEVAAVLATFRGEALILGIDSLTVDVARCLAETQAETLWLPALTTLSAEAANEIKHCPGRLVLSGLETLESPELAGKLASASTALSLPFLRDISSEVAAALARHEYRLTLGRLQARSLEVQNELARTIGSLALPSLQRLDSFALTEKLKGGNVVLKKLETLTVPQIRILAGERGQDSFFGGLLLPTVVITPEIAAVLAETPRSINLVLFGEQLCSNEALELLLASRLRLSFPDVESLSPEQIELVVNAMRDAEPNRSGLQFPRLSLPKLRRLSSSSFADALGRSNQFRFDGVRAISPSVAFTLGSLPEPSRSPNGQLGGASMQLSFPDLVDLPSESAADLLRRSWVAIEFPRVSDVSLDTVRQLADRTQTLTIGIRLLPEEFAGALGRGPFDGDRGSGWLRLPRLRSITPAAASKFVGALNGGISELRQRYGERVAVPKLTIGQEFSAFDDGFLELSPEIAIEFSKFEGNLSLEGLGDLSGETCIALANFKGPNLTLSGPGVERLSMEGAAALARLPGVLRLPLRHLESVPLANRFAKQLSWSLSELETLTPESAQTLAQYNGLMGLDSLTVLDSSTLAQRLIETGTGGNQITLRSLRRVSPEAAKVLGQGDKPLWLGLTVLDDVEVVSSLARSSAGVQLPRLRAVTPSVLALLRDSPSITAPALASLYVLDELPHTVD